jgi:hypothetical protein
MREHSARQGFLGQHSDEALANASVAIVGNCGGGSHVAQQLAHVGVGNFLLVDPDVVEEVNLNRMIGSTPEDARHARYKTAVIDRLIRSAKPDARVLVLESKWQECAIHLRGCDIVFGCVDGYTTRSELEAYCRRFLISYVDVGMDVSRFNDHYTITGQVITSIPGRACMWCMGFLTQELLAEEAGRYGDAGPRPQVVWPNGVLASLAVGIGIRLITPWSQESISPYLVYDWNRQIVSSSSRLAHINPLSCVHYPIEEVGDPLWLTPSGTSSGPT